MKKHLQQFRFVALVAVLVVLPSTATGQTPKADPSVQKTFDKLLSAIKASDREMFVADATDAVKQVITQQVMDGLSKQLGSRLKKGYDAAYLCQLKQAGHQVHLWKLTFKDGGDDVVIRVALKD